MADRRRDRDNKERDGVSRARVIATARVTHASRVLAIASRDRGLSGRLFLQDTKTNTRGPTRTGVACATQTKKERTVFLHFKSSCFERRTRGRAVRSTLILLFCEEVFSRSEPDWRIPESVYSERGPKKLKSRFSVTLANEADRFEYSGSWLAARRSFGLTFFPPSPLFGTPAFCLCAKRTLSIQRSGTPLGGQTTSLCSAITTIGSWEIVSSYSSATAPASRRISRADPLFQTRKELFEQ